MSDILSWIIAVPMAVYEAYSWLVRTLTDTLRELFESYGYFVVFFGTLFENTLFLGALVPGALLVLLAGISVGNGDMNPVLAIALATGGTCIGDTISYFMGRFGWTRMAGNTAVNEFAEKVREPILKRGVFFVVLYHFAGYTRLFGPAGAGMLGMPYRRWAIADHLGALTWITSHVAIGYGLAKAGVDLDSTDQYFKYFEWALLVLLALWVTYLYRSGWGTFRKLFDRSDTPPPPPAGPEEKAPAQN